MKRGNEQRHTVRLLCEGAMMVVLAQLLGYIKLWQLPWGGSVCLSMLPVLLYACRWGIGAGLMSGLVLGTCINTGFPLIQICSRMY